MVWVRELVVVLASVTLAAGALNAARATTAGLRIHTGGHDRGWRTVAQIEGLRRQFVVLVPPGARVLVGMVPAGYLAWEQRIAEVAILEHRRVATDRADADYRVSIVEDATGLRIVAEALR
jgi:hypothetical protein